jgi:WD40 repeat protein
VEAGKSIVTFDFPNNTDYMQLGCLWQGQHLVSLGLNGHLTYLDRNNPGRPIRVVKGHNKFVTSFAYDRNHNSVYTGSYDAIITRWNVDTGDNDVIPGAGHTNQINGISIQNGKLFSCGMDDSVRVTPLDGEYGDSASLDSPAKGIATGKGDVSVVATMKSVYLFDGLKKAQQLSVGYNPQCVAVSPDGTLAAVGGGDDFKVHVYNIAGNGLKEVNVLERHTRQVTAVAFSPDGHSLASGDQKNEIILWDTRGWTIMEEGWCHHTGSVKSLAWSPSGTRLASGSLDQCVIIWSLADRFTRVRIPNAHRGGVNAVLWIDDRTVASTGQDCTWKTWNV